MSWRTVVVASNAKLDYQLGYLVIRKDVTRKIHLNEIAILMIESTAVSLTTYLLCELTKKKIKVIFCDEKRNPSAELLPYYGSHDTSLKVRSQVEWTLEVRQMVWTAIVTEKIHKQTELLDYLKMRESDLLKGYLKTIKFADATNREGHAAKVYFNALFGKEFTRASETPWNAALNYGYSILLSAFNREIAINGYLTQLGLFHGNQFNPFNLASDLMEPFRPLIDAWVYANQPQKLESEEKMELVNILNQEVIIADRTEYVGNAIGIYTRSVFDALQEQDISQIRFYRNELSIYENHGNV